ncbi:MAG: hypothetical protein JWM17_2162 [Actinobacteria bacterium]|jgi:hypothetical protein|nr:hypothetical protein [Actinomycetota bacterium]MCW3042216.1 hypothetical protein [Actinomycetota bacterium]
MPVQLGSWHSITLSNSGPAVDELATLGQWRTALCPSGTAKDAPEAGPVPSFARPHVASRPSFIGC